MLCVRVHSSAGVAQSPVIYCRLTISSGLFLGLLKFSLILVKKNCNGLNNYYYYL